jgi:hypothetical protein
VSLLDTQGEIVGKPIDLLQGTLDMLILKAVSLGPLHGYGVLLRIQQISGEQLEIQQGMVESEGFSNYNALESSLTKRISHGLQFLASYTWSKTLSTDPLNDNADAGASNSDRLVMQRSWGPVDFNHYHRVVVSYVYSLRSIAHHAAPARLLNGWNTSGVVTIQTGQPLSLTFTNSNNYADITTDYAEIVPGCALTMPGSVKSKLNNYFNTSCLANPPVIGSDGEATGFGNSKPGIVVGPGQHNFDLALAKRTPLPFLGEAGSLEFTTQFFNAFNTPQFANPQTSYASIGDLSGFGTISGTVANARIIQFGLKTTF